MNKQTYTVMLADKPCKPENCDSEISDLSLNEACVLMWAHAKTGEYACANFGDFGKWEGNQEMVSREIPDAIRPQVMAKIQQIKDFEEFIAHRDMTELRGAVFDAMNGIYKVIAKYGDTPEDIVQGVINEVTSEWLHEAYTTEAEQTYWN